MKNRTYDDDDGRVIADMSDLRRQPMVLPRLSKRGTGMNIESLCLLSSQSFAIEYTPRRRRIAGSRPMPERHNSKFRRTPPVSCADTPLKEGGIYSLPL